VALSALEALEHRWFADDGAFQDRIGWLASRVATAAILTDYGRAQYVLGAMRCSQDELDEYRAYIVHARLVGFLEEPLACEALERCAAMQQVIDTTQRNE
jgi:hypothetical protein